MKIKKKNPLLKMLNMMNFSMMRVGLIYIYVYVFNHWAALSFVYALLVFFGRCYISRKPGMRDMHKDPSKSLFVYPASLVSPIS
jgi:hypothetical protein